MANAVRADSIVQIPRPHRQGLGVHLEKATAILSGIAQAGQLALHCGLKGRELRLDPGDEVRAAYFRPGQRHEPLYSLNELAEKFGCPMLTLRGLLSTLPDKKPEPRCKSTAASRGFGAVNLYPLSEFRRWAAHHKIDFGSYTCKR